MSKPHVIGWRERIDLPGWQIEGIEAKSDTGARSSAIDVKNLLIHEDGYATFEVALSRADRDRTRPVRTKIKRRTQVKSSNGHLSDRVVVETRIRVGPVEKTIDVTLVCRKRMQCRMLIGRTALQEDFLVSSSDKYVLTQPAPRKKRKSRSRKKIRTADSPSSTSRH